MLYRCVVMPNHRLPLLANTAIVNGSARALYRLAVKNVVDTHVWTTLETTRERRSTARQVRA
jgi:hypothetical protein